MKNTENRYSLGLDLSTQSVTASLIDYYERSQVLDFSIDYLSDEISGEFGIGPDYLLPPSEVGEALQPADLFPASLDAAFRRLMRELGALGIAMDRIACVNFSAQQHGHVFLDRDATRVFSALNGPGDWSRGLTEILGKAFSVPFARIWRTSNTAAEADLFRQRLGGAEKTVALTGSNAPLRFSAFGIMKTAHESPETYSRTGVIHQLNSLVAAILTGNPDVPLDFGNACGVSLMDYSRREWSSELLDAAGRDLPGGPDGLAARLPRLSSALAPAGTAAMYFVDKYGLDPSCLVGVGSGDNPQSKVPSDGILLSLGTSIVLMAPSDGMVDPSGGANAMYDGLDRPFLFGCRTNGTLRWDELREMHGLSRTDYEASDAALKAYGEGDYDKILLWQAEEESFPVSRAFGMKRIGYEKPDFAEDCGSLINATLGLVYLHSKVLLKPGIDRLYVTGGASASQEIFYRISDIWNFPVFRISGSGAALGAAVSGAVGFLGNEVDPTEFASAFTEILDSVEPNPQAVRKFHRKGGFLERLREAFDEETN